MPTDINLGVDGTDIGDDPYLVLINVAERALHKVLFGIFEQLRVVRVDQGLKT